MAEKENSRSWCVLAGVAFVMFSEAGVVKSFGVLLPDLTEQFATDTWIVGSCVSVIIGWGYALGLSADALVKAIGPRYSLMLTGLVSSLGLIVCACATTMYTFLFGLILTGFLLLQVNIATGMIPQYFAKYYNTAVNMYCCGYALGIIVMPLMVQVFLDAYGLRGTLLLLSGLNMHSIPCGALFIKQHQLEEAKGAESNPLLSSDDNLLPTHSSDDSDQNISSQLESTQEKRRLFVMITSIPFIARVIIPSIVYGIVCTGWLIYIVSFALSIDASLYESSVVAAFGGIGMLVVKITLPLLHKLLTYKQLMYVSSYITAVFLILTTIFTNYIGLCITSFVFGIGIGILSPETYIAAKDVVDQDKYVSAVACSHVFYGIASIVSGFITGILFDVTESFTLSFSILAAVSLLTAVALGLEDIWSGIAH